MPAVRSLIRNMLAGGGLLQVVEVEDGERAWEALTESQARFDLVIADWNMPRMNGGELLKRVQMHSAEVPRFILITGDGSLPALRRLQGQPGVSLLLKPFQAQQLLELIFEKPSLKP